MKKAAFKKVLSRISHGIRKVLLSFSIEKLITMGVKTHMPQRQLIMAYIGYSIIGVCLLCLPFSHIGEIGLVDTIFTVVSAVSTTGLSTVDVATQYTFFGQLVILLLIQMGGLGYMTLSAFIILKMTGYCTMASIRLFNAQFSYPETMDLASLLRSTVNYTFLFEFLGFVLLCPYFLYNDISQPVWSAIFHSVSAFCTAGFSIYTDNLMQFQDDVFVNIVIMCLSIMGAMGFIMMTDIGNVFTRKNYKITFTSKVILSITGGLVLWGMLHFYFCENSFRAMSTGDRFLASLFQSVSAMTTVGFNTVDVSLLTPISMFILLISMYLGASPSGTGGGLKSTTLSAIYAYTKSRLQNNKDVTLKGNIIPPYRVEIALTTTLFYSFILILGIYFIGVFEPDNVSFLDISFEAASALATAGISSGILTNMSAGGKIILIILMFIGRVGVITFGNALLIHHSKNEKTEKSCDIAV